MCISIQNGDNTLKSQLWDNVSKIYYFLADKFFSNNAEKCTKCGLQRDDIHQLSYFAFEHSIKAFDISKGYAFTTYDYKDGVMGPEAYLKWDDVPQKIRNTKFTKRNINWITHNAKLMKKKELEAILKTIYHVS